MVYVIYATTIMKVNFHLSVNLQIYQILGKKLIPHYYTTCLNDHKLIGLLSFCNVQLYK
jgi:hypothetical protein